MGANKAKKTVKHCPGGILAHTHQQKGMENLKQLKYLSPSTGNWIKKKKSRIIFSMRYPLEETQRKSDVFKSVKIKYRI